MIRRSVRVLIASEGELRVRAAAFGGSPSSRSPVRTPRMLGWQI